MVRARTMSLVGKSGQSIRARSTAALHAAAATRGGRVALAGATTLAARGISMLTLLFSVPFASHVLSPERFALWIIVSGFAMIFGFADLGIGGSVLNEVAAAEGSEDHVRSRLAVSNGLAALTLIGAAFALLSLVAVRTTDWAALLGVRDPRVVPLAAPSVLAFGLIFAASLPFAIAGRVQAGMQQAFLTNIVTIFGGLGAFAATLLGLYLRWDVPALVASMFGPPALAQALNYALFFHIARRDLIPRFSDVTRWEMLRHARTGLAFFGLQMTAIAMIRFDAIIVANRSGAAAGGAYAALDRLFALAAVVTNAFTAPLWPAYREALNRGDRAWAQRTLRKSTLLGAAFTLAVGLVVVVLRQPLQQHWFKGLAAVPLALFAAMALLRTGEALALSVSMYLNGAGRLRALLIVSAGIAAFSMALKAWLPVAQPDVAVALIGAASFAALALGGFFLAGKPNRVTGPGEAQL